MSADAFKVGDRVRVLGGWDDPAVLLAVAGPYAWVSYFDSEDVPETVALSQLRPADTEGEQ